MSSPTAPSTSDGDRRRIAFFDDLAPRWDAMVQPETMAAGLAADLQRFGLADDETVLDLGCGTGVLLRALLARLGPAGRAVAVDFSGEMLAQARAKHSDPRVIFHRAAASHLPLGASELDRALCFSAWPHFERPLAVIEELARVLRPGGRLHIWHAQSRKTVNAIHHHAGPAVASDLLVPGDELAEILAGRGFEVTEVVDDDRGYCVSARRGTP